MNLLLLYKALHLKKVDYDYRAIHLVKDGGEQLKDEYR